MPSHRLKVLFLASYFPKPDNPLMGTWALEQAKALVRQGIELCVVSFTAAIPKSLAMTTGAKAYAHCPPEHLWPGRVPENFKARVTTGINVLYPRWLYYPIEPIKSWMYRHPGPYLKIAQLSSQRQFTKLVKDFCPDLLFCHHSLPNGWLAASQAANFCQPMITFDHDYDEIADCRNYPHRAEAMQTVVDQAWAMLSVSKRMQADLQAQFPSARRLATHSIGVNLPLSHHQQTHRPPELQGKTVVLSCALFAKRKGIPLLIEAFCSIAHRYPDAILRIVGGGPDAAAVRAAVATYDQTGQIQMLGKKSHAEVLQEMCWADCFALVSWDEPLGAVYLEAMAASKPILCANDGGINDAITSGIHGYAVTPKSTKATAEALDKLLADPDKRLEMGGRSRQLIEEKLTWDARAKDLVALFDQAVREQPSP
jgi:glycosyltransferase involved in cell wall biosynthesis